MSTYDGNIIIKCEKRVDEIENNYKVTRKKFIKKTATENRGYKQFYTFKHPLSANCGETDSKCGFILRESKHEHILIDTLQLCTESDHYNNTEIHTHDNISAEDMYIYATRSVTDDIDRVTLPVAWWRWRWMWWSEWNYWLPGYTDIRSEEVYVAYNVKQYTVAK